MELLVRFVRAFLVFATIFSSYMIQLGLGRLFRQRLVDDRGYEDFILPDWLHARRKVIDRRNARRLLAATLRLRGVYIKLGQVLSIMGGFLPRAYAEELEVLQDKVPPRSFGELRSSFERTLGKSPEACFAAIDETPLAAASLGQVHLARGHDGAKLAVKVLYPGIRAVIATDMRIVRLGMWVYSSFVPIQNLQSAYDSLVDLLRRETSYLHEAECMRRMKRNFAGQDDIVIPDVVEALTSQDVLTMTFMEGFKITDTAQMAELGIDPNAVATRFTQCFYEQMFVHRFFHADPHPGNFFVQPGPSPEEPRIVILDFGAISEVSPNMLDGMIDVLQGFFEQNDALVVSGVQRIGFVAEDGNRALVEKTILTYFRKLLQIEDRSAGAIMSTGREELERLADPEVERRELRELMKSFRYPEGWFYVERASVLAFWLIGQIDRTVDTLSVGFAFILPLLAERTARREQDAAGAAELAENRAQG
jgi:ubiquinone biosynthesis protein